MIQVDSEQFLRFIQFARGFVSLGFLGFGEVIVNSQYILAAYQHRDGHRMRHAVIRVRGNAVPEGAQDRAGEGAQLIFRRGFAAALKRCQTLEKRFGLGRLHVQFLLEACEFLRFSLQAAAQSCGFVGQSPIFLFQRGNCVACFFPGLFHG